jgi:hypothetical protein
MRAAVLLVLLACGPSASEVRTARTATYAEPPAQLFERAQRAANTLYGIATVNAAQLGFITRPFLDAPYGTRHKSRYFWAVRVGIVVHVVRLPSGRSALTMSPLAQRSSTPCDYPCKTTWVDVPLRDVEPLSVDVQQAIDRLAVAIHDGDR